MYRAVGVAWAQSALARPTPRERSHDRGKGRVLGWDGRGYRVHADDIPRKHLHAHGICSHEGGAVCGFAPDVAAWGVGKRSETKWQVVLWRAGRHHWHWGEWPCLTALRESGCETTGGKDEASTPANTATLPASSAPAKQPP
jgi:hypothetical protein